MLPRRVKRRAVKSCSVCSLIGSSSFLVDCWAIDIGHELLRDIHPSCTGLPGEGCGCPRRQVRKGNRSPCLSSSCYPASHISTHRKNCNLRFTSGIKAFRQVIWSHDAMSYGQSSSRSLTHVFVRRHSPRNMASVFTSTHREKSVFMQSKVRSISNAPGTRASSNSLPCGVSAYEPTPARYT